MGLPTFYNVESVSDHNLNHTALLAFFLPRLIRVRLVSITAKPQTAEFSLVFMLHNLYFVSTINIFFLLLLFSLSGSRARIVKRTLVSGVSNTVLFIALIMSFITLLHRLHLPSRQLYMRYVAGSIELSGVQRFPILMCLELVSNNVFFKTFT